LTKEERIVKMGVGVQKWIYIAGKFVQFNLHLFDEETEIPYYIVQLLFTMLGLFQHNFFYCFHMTEIIIRYPTLKTVVACVWNPRLQ
jgi:hypothetical protein